MTGLLCFVLAVLATPFKSKMRLEAENAVLVVFGEHLRRILRSYARCYNGRRTHLSLNKDAPISRAAETAGRIICHPILGGLQPISRI
jgi:hypothetical protein